LTEDEHPGLRPALLAAGLAVLAFLVVPLGALIRSSWSPLISLDNRVERSLHADAVEHAGSVRRRRRSRSSAHHC